MSPSEIATETENSLTDEISANSIANGKTLMRDPALTRLLDESRKALIETGTRNRLVHTNRTAKRPATLSILHSDASELFNRLIQRGGKLRFLADPAATERERKRASEDAQDIDGAAEFEASYDEPITIGATDTLQTKLGENALQKRLLKFYREAKALEDEQGINILYLAIGFLRWFEDERSEVIREAPLILVPVSLERDVRRSAFDLRAREDDLSINLPLSERLRDQEGIVLPDFPEGDDWRANEYFDLVAQAIFAKSRWSIDRSGLELGFFSFAKLLMYRDLAPGAWANNAILEHPILRGLMVDGFAPEEELFPNDTKLDERFQPADLIHVVDADGSQALVIETVRAGRNLVVQGPPGTGKSQTITNIIASAAHDGKRVLFIAEKMVALHVVHDRLKKVGLSDLCLELHSRGANKRLVSQELAATLAAGCTAPDVTSATRELTEIRDKLNRECVGLHAAIGATGSSAFSALGDLVRAQGLGIPPASTPIPDVTTWTKEQYKDALSATARLAGEIAKAGPPHLHPWFAVGNLNLQPTDLTRLEATLTQTRATTDGLAGLVGNAATMLAVPKPATLKAAALLIDAIERIANAPRIKPDLLLLVEPLSAAEREQARALLKRCNAYRELQKSSAGTFVPLAMNAEVVGVRSELARGASSFFYRWRGSYRRAVAELESWLVGSVPKLPRERVDFADRLFAVQDTKKVFERDADNGRRFFSAAWQEEQTAFTDLANAIDWVDAVRASGFTTALSPCVALIRKDGLASKLHEKLAELHHQLRQSLEQISSLLNLDVGAVLGVSNWSEASFTSTGSRLDIWSTSLSRYEEWRALVGAERSLKVCGLGALANRMLAGELPDERAVEELRHARAEALWAAARKQNPDIASLSGESRSKLVESFQQLDKDRARILADSIRATHLSNIPSGSLGQMGIIRGEAAKRRAHLPIRKLMSRAGQTVQKIKPIFLMSPISVAQFIPPGEMEFDLLVIDEASQVRPEDALGVIARAKQVVVVGDIKQLPPTSFFSRLVSGEDEDDPEDDTTEPTALQGAARVSEMESVLTLCEARGISSRMLRWHYRSKHHSLIEVSNAEFYRDLVLPPSPLEKQGESGFVFRRVQGAYDRGGKRTNSLEGKAIVDALIVHAKTSPDRSIGVATFSSAQRDEIANQIDEARRTNEALDAFVRDMEQTDEVFIKSIENVQGDERDVILISVGYGPRNAGGRLESMAFGPIATEGGERRLNVLFTRARHRCEVFASFDPGDIDLNRARSEGVRIFKRYLTYAATGVLDQPRETGEDHDSPFEADVAQVIRSLGYVVEAQVGSAGFKIDLAVRHPTQPGRFMLAVECDGATYHGALWARERDRLRQSILEGMGWTFHRIWSSDWFYRRTAEIARLKSVLEKTGSEAERRPAADSTKPPGQVTPDSDNAPEATSTSSVSDLTTSQSAYTVAKFAVNAREEPHIVNMQIMADIIARIVEIEGPIHKMEVARRVSKLFGKERTGDRMRNAVWHAGEYQISRACLMIAEGDFWLTPSQRDQPIVRNRSGAPLSVQAADMLPPTEIVAAIREVFEENGPVSREELLIGVGRAFGYQRSGPDFKRVVETQLEHLIIQGQVSIEGGLIVVGR